MSSIGPGDVSELFYSKEEDIVDALSTTDLQSLSKELFENVVITKQANVMFNSLDHDRLNPRTRARYLLSLVIDNLQEGHDTYPQFRKVLCRRTGACMQLVRWLDQRRVPSNTGEGYLHESDIEFLLDYLIECSHKWEELGAMLGLPTYALENCRIESNMELRLRRVLTEWVTGSYENAKKCTLKTLKASLQSSVVAFENLSCGLEKAYKAHIQSQMVTAITTDPCPIITFKSSDTEVADHKSALLEVQVKETSEPVSYQWMRDGQPLTDSSHFSGTTTAILLINQASLEAEGEYSCQVRCGLKQDATDPIVFRLLYPFEKKLLISRYTENKEIPGSSWPPGTCNIYVELTMVKNSKAQKPSHLVIEDEMEALLIDQEKIDYNTAFGEYIKGAIILVEGRPGSGKTTLANKIVKDWSQGKALKNADMVFSISLRRDLDRSQIYELFYHSQYHKYREVIEESGGENICFVLDGYDEFSPRDKDSSVIKDILSKTYLPASMVVITSRPDKNSLDLQQNSRLNIELLGFTKEHFELYIKNYPFNTSCDLNKEDKIRRRLSKYVKSCTNVLNICYLPINASIICFLFSQHLGDKPPPKTESQIYEALIVAIVLRKMRLQDPSAQLYSLKDLTGKNKIIFEGICTLAFHLTTENKQIFNKQSVLITALKESNFWELFAPDSVFKLHGVEDVFSFIHLTLQEYLAAHFLASLDGDKQTVVIKAYAEHAYHMITTFKFYCGLIDYKAQKERFQDLFSRIPVQYNMLYLAHCVYESQQPELCRAAVNLLNGKIDLKFTTLTPADFTALDYLISAIPQMVTEVKITRCQLYEECIADVFEKRSMDVNKLFDRGMDLVSGYNDLQALLQISPFMKVSYKMNYYVLKVYDIMHEKDRYISYYHRTKGYLMEMRKKHKVIHSTRLECKSFGIYYLDNFAQCLLKCSNLQTLNFTECHSITNTCIRAELLNHTPKLKTLEILGAASASVVNLGKGLRHCKKLQTFMLVDSPCFQEESESLANGLKHCKSLKSFIMRFTCLGSEGAIELARGLKTIPLHRVQLLACDIGHDGITALAHEGFFSQVKYLDLRESAESSTMSYVIQSIPKDLHILYLKGNDIYSSDIITLVEKLNSRNLRCLDLSYSSIGVKDAAALGSGLFNCTILFKLSLSGCNLTTDAMPGLVCGFRYWKHLLHLDLCDNQLSTNAMTSLAEHLDMVPTLTTLCIAHNMVNSRGARALARGIKNCQALHFFNISHNNIGSVGAAALSIALKGSCIKFANFSNNSIDLENELLLINLVNLAKCGSLELLDLSHNDVGSDNTLRLIICLIFHLDILNVATETELPELLVEFVSAFKKILGYRKIHII